jgi:hypothetical protein
MAASLPAPDHIARNGYFAKSQPVVDWEWMLVLGIAPGAFVSSRLSGDRPPVIPEPAWGARRRFAGLPIDGGDGRRRSAQVWRASPDAAPAGTALAGPLRLAVSGLTFVAAIFVSGLPMARLMMAELKRDNGIMAYYHDMFELARANLRDATAIRDNDAAAHYFYAKVLKLVGHTAEEEKLARDEFYKAAKADTHSENFGSHLHLALMMARERSPDNNMIARELDEYVTNYARANISERMMQAIFPPNLETIYQYMTLYGNPGWMPKAPDIENLNAYKVLNALVGPETPRNPPPGPAVAPAAVTSPAATHTPPPGAIPGVPTIPIRPPVLPVKKR